MPSFFSSASLHYTEFSSTTCCFTPTTLVSQSDQIQYHFEASPHCSVSETLESIRGYYSPVNGTHYFSIPSAALASPIYIADSSPHLGCAQSAASLLQDCSTVTDGHSTAAVQFHEMLSANTVIAVLLVQIESSPQPFLFNRQQSFTLNNNRQTSNDSEVCQLGLLFADPRGGQTFFLPFSYKGGSVQEDRHCMVRHWISTECVSPNGKRMPLVFIEWLLNKGHLCVTSNTKQFIGFLRHEFGIHPLCQWFDPLVCHWVIHPNQQLDQPYTATGFTSIIK